MNTLQINLPENVYQSLLTKAEQVGRTPEDLVGAWLTTAVERLNEEPLLRWSGAFASEETDVGIRHDFFLGQALLNELRGKNHG